MKKIIVAAAALCIAASATLAQPLPGPKVGIGAFGGLLFPLVQDDEGNGTVFGLRARLKVIPMIVLEPNVTFARFGDPDDVQGISLGEGSKLTSFGVDATLGAAPGMVGVKPFFFVGIGSYKRQRDVPETDESRLGYSGGLGIGVGLASQLDADVRGKAIVVPQEDGGSKKSLTASVGITFNFGGI